MKHILISIALIAAALIAAEAQNNSKTYALECRDEIGQVSPPIYVYMHLDTENKMIRLRWLSPADLDWMPDQVALRKEKQILLANLHWVYQKDSVAFYPPQPLIQPWQDVPASNTSQQGTHTYLYPDGTQAVAFTNGTTSTIINPDGTHSVAFNNGNTSTVINPDGTHTVIFNNGNTSTAVNPNGTHSVVLNNGSTSTILHPDGTHSVVLHNGSTSTVTGQNATHVGWLSSAVAIEAQTPDPESAHPSLQPIYMNQTDYELPLDNDLLRSIRSARVLEFDIQTGTTRIRAPLLGWQLKSVKRRLF